MKPRGFYLILEDYSRPDSGYSETVPQYLLCGPREASFTSLRGEWLTEAKAANPKKQQHSLADFIAWLKPRGFEVVPYLPWEF